MAGARRFGHRQRDVPPPPRARELRRSAEPGLTRARPAHARRAQLAQSRPALLPSRERRGAHRRATSRAARQALARARARARDGGEEVMALTLGQALAIVEAALRKGRELKLAPLAVAVLDAGGHM